MISDIDDYTKSAEIQSNYDYTKSLHKVEQLRPFRVVIKTPFHANDYTKS